MYPYEASQTLGILYRPVSLDSVDMSLMQKRQDSRMSSTTPRDEVYFLIPVVPVAALLVI